MVWKNLILSHQVFFTSIPTNFKLWRNPGISSANNSSQVRNVDAIVEWNYLKCKHAHPPLCQTLNNFHFLSYLEFCDKNSVYSDRRLLIIKKTDLIIEKTSWWKSWCDDCEWWGLSVIIKVPNLEKTKNKTIRWQVKESSVSEASNPSPNHLMEIRLDLLRWPVFRIISHYLTHTGSGQWAIKTHQPCL